MSYLRYLCLFVCLRIVVSNTYCVFALFFWAPIKCERNRNETKRNEINENETKRNETKRNQRNENEIKRNQRKQNEINENKTK